MTIAADATAVVTILALAQAVAGTLAVRAFAAAPAVPQPALLPPVTVLKPLCGDEPGLEQALASFCGQDYPDFQIVFGVQDPADPAVAVVGRLQAAFPARQIALVADPTPHGGNRKIANLINMLPAARHDTLVIADSDLLVRPDYLRQVVAALSQPGTGLVTSLVTGRAGSTCLAARLGVLAQTCCFLPGVMLARRLGRQDNLGTTMALRRDILGRAGGLPALADELADDAALGQRVRALGLGIALAATLPQVTVPETRVRALFSHELRWGRTIRSLVPVAYAASLLQYPLFWAALTILLAGFTPWSLVLFAAGWAARAWLAALVCRSLAGLGTPGRAALHLLPLRDLMSAVVVVCSFAGNGVTWRGHALRAARPRLPDDSLGMIRR